MSTWLSSYFDPAAAAAKKEKAAAAKEAAHAKAVEELRTLFLQPEGQKAAELLFRSRDVPSLEYVTSDAFLRRWLVARDWDVAVTYKLLTDHAAWRAYNVPNGVIPEAEIATHLGDNKIFLQGVDNQGRALAIIRVRNQVPRKDMREMRKFCIYTMDHQVELCDKTKNPGARLISMFDMTGCSYSNLDVAVMGMVLRMLGDHYVERLSQMWFYNPPMVFWGLWNSMKGLLPEVTRNKIKVIDPSDISELKALVPPEVLPKEYGGEAEFIPFQDAVRKFKLFPFLDGETDCTRGSSEGGAVDATITGLDEAFEQKLKVEEEQLSAAAEMAAAAQPVAA